MATKLGLFNAALLVNGERKLASLTEDREPRRILDQVWDNGFVRSCLEQGQFKFAIRTQRLDYDITNEEFGYRYGFAKADDFVRTAGVAADGYFKHPISEYADEAGFWWADLTELYVRFVSDDSDYGGDLASWPETFSRWVETELASRICQRLTQSDSKTEALVKQAKRLLTDARSKDAMSGPTVFPPQGSWVTAMRGGRFR